MAKLSAARPTRGSSNQRLVHAFVDEASRLPYVRRILVYPHAAADRMVIWTIIAAPPFDFAYSRPVYLAEQCGYDAAPDALVEFHVVNLEELADSIGTWLPTPHAVVYERGLPA